MRRAFDNAGFVGNGAESLDRSLVYENTFLIVTQTVAMYGFIVGGKFFSCFNGKEYVILICINQMKGWMYMGALAEQSRNDYTEDDYYSLPKDVRAELVDGQFYDMASPSRRHQEILNAINNEIYNYLKSKKGPCKVYPAPFAVKLFDDKKNIVEPDISVICDPDKLTDKGCSGAPDWIIEIISPSNAGHDYVRKLNLYMDAGVREYWIIDPDRQKTIVYWLNEVQFKTEVYTFEDRIKVSIYDDFWIDFGELEI